MTIPSICLSFLTYDQVFAPISQLSVALYSFFPVGKVPIQFLASVFTTVK